MDNSEHPAKSFESLKYLFRTEDHAFDLVLVTKKIQKNEFLTTK